MPAALKVFDPDEYEIAKQSLAGQVATMMGRKLEEDDWTSVYCRAKGIPNTGWSNLHIDVMHEGLGVEMKMLRCSSLRGKPIKSVCGTTLMHPAATRSIRIENVDLDANAVKDAVLTQYAELIAYRTQRVGDASGDGTADMRTGWLLWEDNLVEFLYFEEPMVPPDPASFHAEWNETPARGIRKPSKSLWIYENGTDKKRYSVTTTAGIKIQPYFDVPAPMDENLYYFRVQSEPIDADTVRLWVTRNTASSLRRVLGDLGKDTLSQAIISSSEKVFEGAESDYGEDAIAVPLDISASAHAVLMKSGDAVSDEHRVQLLIRALSS